MNERPPDERIRSWLADGPSHGPPRGLEDLLSRIASTDQARRREVHVPMWLAASLMVGVILSPGPVFGIITLIIGGSGALLLYLLFAKALGISEVTELTSGLRTRLGR